MANVLWPSGFTLARWLEEIWVSDGLANHRILEIGCGVGLPSQVAAYLGAQVVATELKAQGVSLAARAAARNLPADIRRRFFATMLDFTDPRDFRIGRFDVIMMAGPIISLPKTEELIEPLVEAVRQLCRHHCRIILVMGSARPVTDTHYHGFSTAMRFLELIGQEFSVLDQFVCSQRGLAQPWSGLGCFMFGRPVG